jgi:cyclopropane fatty-acyl-phospholipid synthase-like methyltransferase
VNRLHTPMTPPRFDVRRYYDETTRSLLRFGQGRTEGAIHRAVWGPGVKTSAGAIHYVEDQIATRIPGSPGSEPRLVDLGCGVGASLCYLASHRRIRGTGVTLSPVQAAAGEARIRAHGLDEHLTCLVGDYNRLPDGLGADAAYAIESFVHGATPDRFFAESARILAPNGALIVCDDFLADAESRTRAPDAGWLERFRFGWHVNTLLTASETVQLARQAGLSHVETLDFSAYLELERPRDLAIAAAVNLLGRLPARSTYYRMLYGGHALQHALKRGWVRYLMLVFRRDHGVRC